jgi:hypothetical protein
MRTPMATERKFVLLGHRRLATTARYVRIATITVCATTSPLGFWAPGTAARSWPAADTILGAPLAAPGPGPTAPWMSRGKQSP